MKTAILIDGSFFQKKFYHVHRRNPSAQDVSDVISKTLSDDEFKDDTLFRTYYYDCYPFDKKLKHPITKNITDYKTTPIYSARTNFLRNLSLMPRIALRSGIISCSGWIIPTKYVQKLKRGQAFNPDMLQPDLGQKEVDIKIGLDMAWISSKRIVDKIVIFTGDSDMVPAMKFARKEGVMVFLAHLGHGVKHALKEHCDGIVQVDL